MPGPVWLLDVDGVVNADRPAWGARPRRGEAYADAIAYRMRWAPGLTERIGRLHRAEVVEVRWCSTWCAYADQLERLFGLPRLGRAFTVDVDASTAGALKLAAARSVLDVEGRRLVWTDDVETPVSGPLYDELTVDGRALLIRPRTRDGLRPGDLERIEAFAAA